MKNTTIMVSLFYLCIHLTSCTTATFTSVSFKCEEITDMEGVSCAEPEEVFPNSRLVKINSRVDKIDILFVMDNSGSMKDEQRAMANQFDSFLEEIRGFDYQIAIITTDWISDQGQFLTFPNGETILSNPKKRSSVHKDNVSFFQQTISPPVKPTADRERGLQALNHALDRKDQSDFFRPHSLIIIIIVSDADNERDENFHMQGQDTSHYEEDYDSPETLFKRINRKHKFSSVVVHSIISDPKNPCASSQEQVGQAYARASYPPRRITKKYGNILTGQIGSICATNYGSQLGSIADYTIKNRLLPLNCYPIPKSISLEANGKPVKFTLKGKKVLINERIPFNAKASLSYRCPI